MKPPTSPQREFIAIYSANFVVGYTFLHYALEAVTAAFMSKAAP